jgi:hypothetical protein
MLGEIVKELKEEKVPEGKQKKVYCPVPSDPRPIMPGVRDINAEMNWYFQKDYPYPKNIGSFF